MAGLRWVRIDSDYFGNPKARTAGAQGRSLHIASVCWSAQHLTDGRVPHDALPVLLTAAGVARPTINTLVTAGLWLPTDDGWQVHDYLKHNPSREAVERKRKRWRAAKQHDDDESMVTG